MRQFSLLLCLLVFAVLCWIAKSNKAPASTVQDEMVLSTTHVTPKPVNTGVKADPIASTSTHARGVFGIVDGQPGVVLAATPHSVETILWEPNQPAKFVFTELRIGEMLKTSSPASDWV